MPSPFLLHNFAQMNIRRATNDDIPRIMEICRQARLIMRSDGNMTQWTGGYPSETVIMSDIDGCVGYVVEEDVEKAGETVETVEATVETVKDRRLDGYFAFIPGIEKTYLAIEGGQWVDDSKPYCTIHRLASTTTSHGIAGACFEWCWSQCRNLRIDTHSDNRIMRHCIEKFGFTYCGVIHLQNGDPRLAYQKL